MTKVLLEFIEKHPGVIITEELDSLRRTIRFTMELGRHRISRAIGIEEIESLKDDSDFDRWIMNTLEHDYIKLMDKFLDYGIERSGGRLNEN